jgi:hypothetical protein
MMLKLAARIHELVSRPTRDSGEGPVPYVVMVTAIAVGALALSVLIIAFATNYLDNLPGAP